jgi:hypothetical protein
MKKKDEPTMKGTWKGGKKAAERQRHAQSVAAAARAGQKIRNKIPASPGDKSSGNELAHNTLTDHELAVLKEAFGIMKRLNEGSGGQARLSRKIKALDKKISGTTDDKWSEDPKVRSAAYDKSDKLQKKVVDTSRRLGRKKGEGETRPLKRAAASVGENTVGAIGVGPLKALGKGAVKLKKVNKRKRATESFHKFVGRVINEVKSNNVTT